MKPEPIDTGLQSLPPSCLGPDGKLPRLTEEEHRRYIESTLRRLDEIEQIPDGEDDPPDALEQMMRGIDETRPHRPMFKGYY
ncbi:MAG: hypothetical protein ACLQGP_16470 [Isosphaeraceae bacterium]